MTKKMSLGDLLAQARTQLKDHGKEEFTQPYIAAKLNLKPQNINKWEKNTQPIPPRYWDTLLHLLPTLDRVRFEEIARDNKKAYDEYDRLWRGRLIDPSIAISQDSDRLHSHSIDPMTIVERIWSLERKVQNLQDQHNDDIKICGRN